MDTGLRGRVIVVTGGETRVGEAVARACVAEGARVALIGRRSGRVSEIAEEIRGARSQDCVGMEAQLEEPESCRDIISQVEARFGELFGLVNIAAVDGKGDEPGSLEAFRESLWRHLVPTYALAHCALPLLKRAEGTIVNICWPTPCPANSGRASEYAAQKGGHLALTREWAAELLRSNIRVNAVVPSDGTRLGQLPKTAPGGAVPEQDNGPEEDGEHKGLAVGIAGAAVFLLSPRQSGHTTGQFLVVDRRVTAVDGA